MSAPHWIASTPGTDIGDVSDAPPTVFECTFDIRKQPARPLAPVNSVRRSAAPAGTRASEFPCTPTTAHT